MTTRVQGSGSMLPPRWQRLLDLLQQRDDAKSFEEDLELSSHLTLGRFLIVARLGAGGMGTVFEALDPDLGRTVALKICKLPADEAAGLIEHEARCLAQLAHPNVVTVYDVFRDGPDLVLVMEYVNGPTLREWQGDELRDWPDIINHYIAAARGVAAAHAVGIEHGDFKPDNVLVGVDGRVRVADFGIARHSYDLIKDPLDLKGKGTRSYMAPERLREQHGGVPADVYAVCVSLWEALYGARPFFGSTVVELLEAIEAGVPKTGAGHWGVPDGVRTVLLRGLSARASERPQSMAELIRALREACETAESRWARRWRRIVIGLVAGLVAASAFGLAMPEPELSPVEQALSLAKEEAQDGDPDDALRYIELARSRARRDFDVDELRRVAEEAVEAGALLIPRGHADQADYSWDVAHDIYLELGDQKSIERLLETAERRSIAD